MNEQVLLGTILGDATIDKTGRYTFEHSLKQKEYALWKAEEINLPFGTSLRDRLDKRTNKIYSSIIIFSKFHELYKYRNLFYPENKKTISNEILNSLNRQAISVWYCDDGGIYYNGNNCHLTLAIDGFINIEEICQYFKEKWNLNFKITQSKRIRLVSRKECEKFFELFQEYIPKCMEYKTLTYAINRHKEKKSSCLR